MKNDLYEKLVDLYAGGELPQETMEELEAAAMGDKDLAHDMFTLTRTVEALHADPGPVYDEETEVRILLTMQLQGAELDQRRQKGVDWQYHLPIQP
ncbi:MAG: hypothetical protein KF884_04205 [Fimbriimonadaceae bacterium]|nr:hypothetical protein [Fimbriimonadaceae bacterium]QYK59293.1 MAG: hypothetical protein KF884_04205 [Fimbriimonadaceae bacterium]